MSKAEDFAKAVLNDEIQFSGPYSMNPVYDQMYEAMQEQFSSISSDPFVVLAYHLSEQCDSRDKAVRARRFMHSLIDEVFEMNMGESENSQHID